jgi:hypothetical protein
MKLFGLFAFATFAAAQTLSLGIQGGVPVGGGFASHPDAFVDYSPLLHRYTAGPVGEFALHKTFRLQAGALYHRTGWNLHANPTKVTTGYDARVRIGAWDFAALLKRRLGGSRWRPFAAAGPAVRRFQTTRADFLFAGYIVSEQLVSELRHKNTPGLSVAAGFDAGRRFAVSPQVRYTRWLVNNIVTPYSVLGSQVNQLDVLLQFTFGLR